MLRGLFCKVKGEILAAVDTMDIVTVMKSDLCKDIMFWPAAIMTYVYGIEFLFFSLAKSSLLPDDLKGWSKWASCDQNGLADIIKM